MSEENENEIPNIEELMAAMRTPERPIEVDEFAGDALAAISQWKKSHTVAIIAGLLTEPRYQVNAIRLDWLLRLVLARSNGKLKPSRSAITRILNKAFKDARVVRLEDPIEDCFCEVVPTSQGDRLIFTGHWEHAAAYTDTVIQAFEHLGDHAIKHRALDVADALLRLSDALCKRAGVTRRAYDARAPWADMQLPSETRLKALIRRVRFTDDELAKLNTSKESLSAFFLDASHFQAIETEIPGDSPLEFYPLIDLEDGIMVAHPGVLSLAARAVLLDTANRGGVSEAFLQNLAIAQERYSEWSGFWQSGQLRLSPPDKYGLSASVCAFAPGRYQHVIQVTAPLNDFPAKGFGEFTPLTEDMNEGIRQQIVRFWKFLSEQQGYSEAITVLLLGGWGSGVRLELRPPDQSPPNGWRFLPLSFADAAQLGACEHGKLKHLWRVVEQIDLLEALGYSVSNVNGTVNLFGNWRETKGQFIPEENVGVDPPCNVLLPIDDLFKPRLEASENRDLRMLSTPDGSFKRVQRINWAADDELLPIYGNLEDTASQKLIGAVALFQDNNANGNVERVWWLEAKVEERHKVGFDWQYQTWNAVIQWLAAVAPHIGAADTLSKTPDIKQVTLVLCGEQPDDDLDPVEVDPNKWLRCEQLEDGTPCVVVQPNWIAALNREENVAEVALAAAVLQQLLRTWSAPAKVVRYLS